MKSMDLSKINKSVMNTLKGLKGSMGFRDPSTWIHTGNFALNYRISGDFFKGFPLEGKMVLLAGESGSGKSYLASGNVVKWCQDNGVLPFIIDTENALDESWVRSFGVDPNNNIVKISTSLIDDIGKVMSDFLKLYKEETESIPYEERQKVLFIIDSLGMAITPTESDQFEKGDMKGDMGRKQKQLYSLCRNFISTCSSEPIGLLCTQHTYKSQDMFSPDEKISGGGGLEFTPSIIIVLQKRKLKEDEDGNKTTDIKGIKVAAMVRKTRYTQPFQKIDFTIPWDTGMNPYSGLFELFSEGLKTTEGLLLTKSGNQYIYKNPNTNEEIFKKFRKNITNQDYDTIMMDYKLWSDKQEEIEKNNLLNNETVE